jgi:hypothetical protein
MKKMVFMLGCAATLFFTACQKELSDNFNAYTGHPLNDTIWVKNVPGSAAVHELVQLLLPDVIVDSFEATKDTTLKYGDSLEVVIAGGSCVNTSGTAVTGKLRLELYRLKKKGDYIKTFTPTTSNGYPLESVGAFFVRILKEGKELTLAPGALIKIRFSDTEAPKPYMQTFNGRESNPLPVSGIDTSFTWIRDSDTGLVRIFGKPSSTQGAPVVLGYEMIAKNLRWLNAQRFIDSTKPKTKINVILPLNYTNKNTAVFAVFSDQKTVVHLRPEFSSRAFSASNIPIGTKLKIVTISRIADAMYLGTKDVNDVGSITAYSVTPEKKSLKDILQFLNNL